MADTHESFRFAVRSYECSPDGLLTLPNLCNYLQEAASVNAEHLGFSKTNFNAAGEDITWVLTRLAVKVLRLPEWGEEISLVTFPRSGRRIVAYRDFTLHDSSNREIARATSEWAVIDMASRRMLPIPPFVFASANDMREPVLGERIEPLEKIPREKFSQTFSTRALKSDIDLNRHVNNVRYIVWAMESLPASLPAPIALSIAFRAEATAGDEIFGHACQTGEGAFALSLTSADGKELVAARLASTAAE